MKVADVDCLLKKFNGESKKKSEYEFSLWGNQVWGKVGVRGRRNEYVGFPGERKQENVKWKDQSGGRKKDNQDHGGGISHLR